MIPTEPIGSIPRPAKLMAAVNALGDGTDPRLDPLYDEAVRETIQQLEATGSPVITDGEQRKYHNFWTYPWACEHRAGWVADLGSDLRWPEASRNCMAETLRPKVAGSAGEVNSPCACRSGRWVFQVMHSRIAAPVNGHPSISRRVLIADDNHDSAESLAMLLRIEGHEVVVAHDGPEALAAVAQFNPEFALLDIGMPRLNGYEVAQRIREAEPASPVMLIAVTGWGQHSDKARARFSGFDHHFTKPVEPERLMELLRAPTE
jgi:CheY-like chemotaxis protein